MEFTIKNYRCFSQENPLKFTLREGLTAFVGPNNAGKSTILKFFFEFRKPLSAIGVFGVQPKFDFRNKHIGFPSSNSIRDPQSIFCNSNNKSIEIEIKLKNPKTYLKYAKNSVLNKISLNYSAPNTEGTLEILPAPLTRGS